MDTTNILKIMLDNKRSPALIKAQLKYRKKHPEKNREQSKKYMLKKKELYDFLISLDKNFFLLDDNEKNNILKLNNL